jgi:hypothetical protein
MEEENIKIKGQIELPKKLDITKYLGKKIKIDKYSIHSKLFDNKKSYFVKIISEPLGTYEFDNEKKDIVASRIFGLQQDKEGNFGWGKETNLGLFMEKMKAKTLDDLKNKEVITQSLTRKDGDYLTFN